MEWGIVGWLSLENIIYLRSYEASGGNKGDLCELRRRDDEVRCRRVCTERVLSFRQIEAFMYIELTEVDLGRIGIWGGKMTYFSLYTFLHCFNFCYVHAIIYKSVF